MEPILQVLFAVVAVRYWIIPFIFGFLQENTEPTVCASGIIGEVYPEPEPRQGSKEKVSIDDMVLHDMVNENDIYDVGAIDFNN